MSKFERERAETEALKEKVQDIQVSLVMGLLGAEPNQDKDRSKWKVPGLGNISVNGQRWYNLNAGRGSVGPINLVMTVMGLKYPQAVRWLANEFGEKIEEGDIKADPKDMGPSEKKTFDPPIRNERYLPFVKHYLHFNRALPMELIEDLIAQRKIYADDDKNCIFFSPGIAEMRSSHDEGDIVKRLATGSSRNMGFLVKADPAQNAFTVAICESAIDSMSYRVMNPGYSVISAAGAGRDFPRQIAEDAISNGYGCKAAFDADEAGDKAAQNLFNHFYVKLWLQNRLQAEMGKSIDEDEIIELMAKGVVDFDVSPPDGPQGRNLLFFNSENPFESADSPPLILLTIKKNDLGLPECHELEMPVTQKGYAFVTEKLKLKRDRPVIGKDWNEGIKARRAQAKPSI